MENADLLHYTPSAGECQQFAANSATMKGMGGKMLEIFIFL